MNIVFMGTPAFALPSLQALLASPVHNIVAIYTKAAKPSQRGQGVLHSEVEELAIRSNLKVPIFHPRTLKSAEEQQRLKMLNPDIIVVVAYGLILPKEVLAIPRYGCINIHPSALPRWRGAAPLQRTLLAGDRQTAVCVIRMDEEMDVGDIILSQEMAISDDMTFGILHNEAAKIGAELLLEALEKIHSNTATFHKQREEGITHAHKLTRGDEKIDFKQEVYLVHKQIMAFSPRPGAYFTFQDEDIKIIQSHYKVVQHNNLAGTVIDEKLGIACRDGIIWPTLLQRPNKKVLYTEAFLRGFEIARGSFVGT